MMVRFLSEPLCRRGAKATRELGKFVTDYIVDSLEKAIKAVKTDTKTLELQKEFYDRVKEP
ncbi:MAG TPA: hypothetical protein VHC96_24665 [Puia sp.]|jgi:creatinine amidohydrolase|nr:hypothetical protein [Puia sp.]